MEPELRPSRMERTYAVAIAVMVPLFILFMWLGGSVTNGVVNVAMLKAEVKNLLAFIGVLSLALWVGNRLPLQVARMRNSFLRAFVRFGVPLFVLTTAYFWFYPTSISFAEHLGSNLLFAIVISFAAREATQSA